MLYMCCPPKAHMEIELDLDESIIILYQWACYGLAIILTNQRSRHHDVTTSLVTGGGGRGGGKLLL